jgi:hypothetical protein
MMIMAKKVTSGVEQYYYCIASVLVASIILIMTTVQTGIVIDEFVNGCADTYTGDPEGLYFDPISGDEYYYSGDDCSYEADGVLLILKLVLWGLSLAFILLATLRVYRVQKEQPRKKEATVLQPAGADLL